MGKWLEVVLALLLIIFCFGVVGGLESEPIPQPHAHSSH